MEEMRPIATATEKLAKTINGLETDNTHFDVSLKESDEAVQREAVDKFNQDVDDYIEKFETHNKTLQEAVKQFASSATVEIYPVANNLIVQPFATNPFQKIRRQGKLYTDLGGMAADFKNTDTGEMEQEKSLLNVAVVIEVGPETKWIKQGDCVMYTKPSAVPIPFYKQGFEMVNENRISAVINEGLTERFNGKNIL